jgi:hypothetical protein
MLVGTGKVCLDTRKDAKMRLVEKLLAVFLRADEIEIFATKEESIPKFTEYHKQPPREGFGEEQTDYQLRVGKYIVYLTRICYSS